MMLRFLRRLFQEEATNAEVLDGIDELYLKIEQMEARAAAFEMDIWEFVEGTLEPVRKRVTSRLKQIDRREEQESLSEMPKKGGILHIRGRGRDGLY